MNILNKIRNLISRAGIKSTNDTQHHQTLHIIGPQHGESHNDIIHHQIYGLSVYAPSGSVPIILELSSDRSQLTAINPSDIQSRPKNLNEGDVVIYTNHGNNITLGANGDIFVTGNNITIEGDNVTINSDNINLGGEDGNKIARIGDKVQIGNEIGQIIEGSNKVKAA